MRRRHPPVRLTRRGRVVLFSVCLVLAGAVAAGTAPASRAADPPSAGGTVVVRPGDTLWSVTARHVPSYDADGVVEEIRRLNDLPGHTIHPGQELTLPARP